MQLPLIYSCPRGLSLLHSGARLPSLFVPVPVKTYLEEYYVVSLDIQSVGTTVATITRRFWQGDFLNTSVHQPTI